MNETKKITEELCHRFTELGVECNEKDIEDKLRILTDEFKVPLEEAKKSIIAQMLRSSKLSKEQFYSPAESITKIEQIQAAGSWVDLKVRVIQLWMPENPAIKQVGLLGDETGVIKFINWVKSNLPPLEEGKCYHIKRAVSDEWQGRFSVKFNRKTKVKEIAEEIEVSNPIVELEGALIDIQTGSGLIKRCPSCKRVLTRGICAEHGSITGEYDLRVKAVIDTGRETQDIILNRAMVEQITGTTLESAKEMALAALDANAVLDEIKGEIVGRYFRVRGPRVGRYILAEEVYRLENFYEDGVDELIAAMEG
ncbi:MAG: replication factor A [Methanocellales archaeon]